MERITDKMENYPPLERLVEWIQTAKYRVIMHRHDNTFRAIDEACGFSWTADSLLELEKAIFNEPPVMWTRTIDDKRNPWRNQP